MINIDTSLPVVGKPTWVFIDTEVWDMQKEYLHIPHGKFAMLQVKFLGEDNVYIFTKEETAQEAMLSILKEGHRIVAHNSKFDIKIIRHFLGKDAFPLDGRFPVVWDTMLVARVLDNGRLWYASLKDLLAIFCNIVVDKDTRSDFNSKKEISWEMLEYAAKDVIYLEYLFRYQYPRAKKESWAMRIYKEIEWPFLATVIAAEERGIYVDRKQWLSLYEESMQIVRAMEDKYPKMNLNSTVQIQNKLKELGYNVESTAKSVLEELSDECEFARDLLEYRFHKKRASTYGKEFADKWILDDSRIHPVFNQLGTETGRLSSEKPNLQNIPSSEDFRSCFRASSDDVAIVTLDWSSQEPRISAFVSGDERLIELFNSGQDVYSVVGQEVFGWETNKETKIGKANRKKVKSILLGLFYGMGARALAAATESTVADARQYQEKVFEAFPGVKKYVEEQKRKADRQGYVKTVLGRRIYLPFGNKKYRNALNAPIQGTGADILKMSANRIHKFLLDDGVPEEFGIVNFVHDEIVLELPKDDKLPHRVSTIERIMEETAMEVHKGVVALAEPNIGEYWSK